MKLVLMSDIHGNTKICEAAVKLANKNNTDIIIAGDLMLGTYKDPEDQLKKVLSELSKCKNKVYVIPGNYEIYKSWLLITDPKLAKYNNIIDFDKKLFDLGDAYLLGYGGGKDIYGYVVGQTYFVINPENDRLLLDKVMSNLGKKLIFVSHMPPESYCDLAVFKWSKEKGYQAAKIGDPDAQTKHAGDKVLKELVEKNKPVLTLFGHIHEAAGYEELFTHAKVKNSKNLLINPGSEEIYLVDVKNDVKIIEIIKV
ncbi:Calcineurin-like phosphoesterase [Candidatus Tiddalikarchaeum anstoanum]|nr:Calcineurin-like phosphoesterase [Candidatus Tiddalikarchaeum anstoanum]